MYLLSEMVDLGLPEGHSWPSEDHKVVASTLLISNSRVSSRSALQEGVAAVLRVPQDCIRTVTVSQMVTDFKFPQGLLG